MKASRGKKEDSMLPRHERGAALDSLYGAPQRQRRRRQQQRGPLVDVCAEVKDRTTAAAVAERYGFTPNGSGFIRCPFHSEKTASLKLYPGGRGWYCFGCGVGGSVIDFVAMLYNLSPVEAAHKINADMGLAIPVNGTMTPAALEWLKKAKEKEARREAFNQWIATTLDRLMEAVYTGNEARKRPPADWSAEEEEAVRKSELLTEWLDTLCIGDGDSKEALYREKERIDALCKKIGT